MDTNWSKETLANKISAIKENIKLIPNTTTKITPFEAHFGRKPNTPTSNLVTHPNKKNLTYSKMKQLYLDKKILRRPMLDQQSMWNFSDSEPNLDIQYNTHEDSEAESDTIPLARQKQKKRKQISPIKNTTDKLSITFGDKTSIQINNRKQIARKTLMRRAPEPRGTLKPLWNITPDGTITDYTPTTISIDTHNRTNTRIRKSDLGIATEAYQKPTPPPQTQNFKPRLMNFVACKTVREYNSNREKTRKFCLEEKKQLQGEAQHRKTLANMKQNRPSEERPGTSYTTDRHASTHHLAEPSSKTILETGHTKKAGNNAKSPNRPKTTARAQAKGHLTIKTVSPPH